MSFLFFLLLFFASGFVALTYQVLWQRMLTLVVGVDLHSASVIVAAFMVGLGIGSYVGGYYFARLKRWQLVIVVAIAELWIGICGLYSVPICYDWLIGKGLLSSLNHLTQLCVVFLLLLLPTIAMGVTLPLISQIFALKTRSVPGTIGALYSVNTLGACFGAFFSALFLLRNFGISQSAFYCSVTNFVIAAATLVLLCDYREVSAHRLTPDENDRRDSIKPSNEIPFGGLLVVYGLAGFLGLGLEMVWFRMLGIILKSNSFTFGYLISVYLWGLGIGGLLGIWLVRYVRNHSLIYLLLQAIVPIYAMVSVGLFCVTIWSVPLFHSIWGYLGSYDPLPFPIHGLTEASHLFWLLYGGLCLFFIFPPTLLMGLSFPLLQSICQQNGADVGKKVGILQAVNILGSTLGALVVGLVFLNYFGTPITIRLLGSMSLGFYLVALVCFKFTARGKLLGSAVFVCVLLLGCLSVPTGNKFWSKLHGTNPANIIVAEDGAGVSALIGSGPSFSGSTSVYVNGLGQSWIPFGGIHTLLGMVPAFIHPNPTNIAVIGLGSGDTVYAAGGRAETKQIDCIELIGAQAQTLRSYSEKTGYQAITDLLNDKRIEWSFTDGRKKISADGKRYDLIELDALRPNSGYAGNLYSIEFLTMLAQHLNPGGLVVSWIPTPRSEITFRRTFDYVARFESIMVGSNQPIDIEASKIHHRAKEPWSVEYYKKAGLDLDQHIAQITAGLHLVPSLRATPLEDQGSVNTDLFPRDEFES